MTVSYKETIFLPRTSFPMKGNLPTQEPKILEKWQKIDLYKKLRENAKDCEKFILHDGPPFANGHIHMGTSLNKIVKDVVIKAYQMRGYDAPYVPGWDCHGLPIERQIEEKARKAGKVWEDIPIAHIRSDCRKEAKKWVDIQRSEFKRLGVLGDWENPYLTMDFHSESLIVKSLFDFLMMGNLYKGVKPIMWSVVEKTALADAEIEYHDKTSSSIYVRFPVSKTDFPELKGSAAVIWTTTPWTFPGNRAVCFGPEVDYLLIKIKKDVEKDSDHKGSLKVGETLIIAKELLDDFKEKAGIESCDILKEFKGEKLGGTICHHPFHGKGYEHDVPLLPGDHVTIDQGTGLVHTAPGHGEEDFFIGKQFNLEVPETVGPDGLFYEQVPLFAGQHVFKADDKVIEQLQAQDALISADKIVHSYPCSWRSKAPLIYRTTPQWFVSMEKNNLREKSLKAIEDTNWVPAQSRNRIQAMMNGRPDWCLSRQRAWGIPIPLFVSKTSGDVLKDEKVNDRIVEAFSEEGTDIWFTKDPQEFLGKAYVADDYEQVKDIADVWFESGASYRFVLQTRKDLAFPASLYLEGSDQHRGWFQVSLLESCALEGIAPFKSVLTHGFVLDKAGYKMSKSLGNVISPLDLIKDFGADIIRLWAISSNYTEDLRIGKDILQQLQDIYRRFRNTLRFLLGNLSKFSDKDRVNYKDLPELEKYVLHRLQWLDGRSQEALKTFNFHVFLTELHTFCSQDLSAFYFDIRKDSLYCDAKNSDTRKATLTVLDHIFTYLTKWLAPILCFTAEEAYLARFPESEDSIHLETFRDIPSEWLNDTLNHKWNIIRNARRVITGALEKERALGKFGSSLQASIMVHADSETIQAFMGQNLADISIVSSAQMIEGQIPEKAFTLEDVPNVGISVQVTSGEKCERCWKILPEVGDSSQHSTLCKRCIDAVNDYGQNDAA